MDNADGRHHVEGATHEQGERLFRAVFEASIDAVVLVDDDGRYVEVNSAASELLGLPREAIVGRSALEFIDPGHDLERSREELRARGQLRGELTVLRPDGTRRNVEYAASRNIRPGLHLSVMRDITDRHRADAEVRRWEGLFRAVLEKTPEGVLLSDADGRAVYVSPAVSNILGYSSEDLLGRRLLDVVQVEDRADVEALRAQLESGALRSAQSVVRISHKDGSARWIEVSLTNLLEEPAVAATVCNMRDVTARRRADEAIRASEERYRRIVEGTSEGVLVYDATGATRFVNRRLALMLGCSAGEAVARSVLDFVDPAHHAISLARLEARRKGAAERFNVQLRRADGTQFWASVHSDPIFDDRGEFEGALLLVTDVTAEYRAEATRAELAAIVESSDDAIMSVTLDGIIASWNAGATRLYGYAAAEAIGKRLELLSPPERRAELEELVRRTTAAGAARCETVQLRKDGSPADVALTFSVIADGSAIVRAVSIIAHDIGPRRAAEAALRQVQEQLWHAQKMEAVGRLAGGIAHNFNNLLSVVLGSSELALSMLKPGDPIARELEAIRDGSLRGSSLTRQLLAFTRQQVLRPEQLDLNATLRGMQTMLERVLGQHILLAIELTSIAATVMADRAQLEQVVLNLAMYARDAMPHGGRLTISTAHITRDGVPQVSLAVTDTGPSMTPETRARIFDPFFTTKELGKGSGLGLAAVFGIVTQSGGDIVAESREPSGTTFRVYFPHVDAAIATLQTRSDALQRGMATILLVEDDEQVRRVAGTILSRAGYHLVEAANAREALEAEAAFEERLDLVVTDLIMPGLNGRELFQRLAQRRPGLKVVFMSGYTDDAVLLRGVREHGFVFLQKPFTRQALLTTVRETLDG